MSTAAQIAANQANARLSTGPQTEAGKTTSSQNNFRHGLSGAFTIQKWENADHYDQLLEGLRNEHQPATPTEALLVERMAQHWWLGQRALSLQEFCFHDTAPMIQSGNEKEFALYLRYQTTHERAFGKCLNDFTKLRAEQSKAVERTERLALASRAQQASLQHQALAEIRKTELHAARLESLQAKTERDQAKIPATVASLPNLSASYADPQGCSQSTLASSSRIGHDQIRDTLALDAERQADLEAFLQSQAA